ncbi:TolC family protein [Mariprofundus erugo]|uniref:TolC family protein n=1 Tax=Mariprofundus erugo TaxID=2528639 RepID=A0A5R9GPY6_9PROT|nr:TolC family protein [Mariprofundus erugo]TLS66483.1 TolC family protein [Mariprofundus erugo]TLS77872.1 TolC family protein [Mariprofundus erugo]
MTRLLRLIAWISLALPATTACANTISLDDVITAVIQHDPGLAINRLDRAIAAADRQRIEGLLDPVVTASMTASQEQTPVASDFQPIETRTAVLAGSVAKPLASGDTVSANINFNRSSQDFISPLAAQLAKFKPAYRNQINISLRHPLWRGADNPAYLQGITVSDASSEATRIQQQTAEHALALQAINASYKLASDDIDIHIAAQAVERARRLLGYQRSREQFGLIEQADRLQAEALLAARQTDLQQAKARRASDLGLLNRMMHRPDDSPLTVELPASALSPPDGMESMLESAKKKRPELKALQAQLKAADAQLLIASDGDQAQLDLIAQLGTRSLAGTPVTAAARGLSIHDHFASISVEYSDTPGRNSVRAALLKAELARERIVAQQTQTIELISDQLAAAATTLVNGTPALHMAQRQAEAEARKFNAEMKRYREGRSDTSTLVQFEGDLSTAELRAQLQQLTLQLAAMQLAWARGDFPKQSTTATPE